MRLKHDRGRSSGGLGDRRDGGVGLGDRGRDLTGLDDRRVCE